MYELVPLGQDEPAGQPAYDVAGAFARLDERLIVLNATAEKDLFWRRVSAVAAIVGTAFAASKLIDIWQLIQRRRGMGG